ncbi:lysosomal Pro-X carboxypeptidase-like [Ruditapes philippinarum]|uniref:lysosomal Pro-X carboxypeptidase-like n=1 Tax=Ruditapes philippinarum TaxID=129788 RepID=UPI00295B9FF3|nr:lysosomal Pro-X carboxypeptidase-like [Ruditapes philippinarum]
MKQSYLFLIVSIVFVGFSTGKVRFPHRHRYKQAAQSNYTYVTEYFVQKVDHFGFENDDTYKQRYLIADQYWNKNGGPIFFYTGNEGDIAWFCNNTGFMWDIAGEFNALLVFAEHRYYGESIPYGPDAYKSPKHMNYLTSEQALADFVVLIKNLKQTIPGAQNSLVVAFGGSYGGMLSAWLRIKYPNVVVGALAASAPIWQFTGLTPCEAFNKVIANVFTSVNRECFENIQKSWEIISTVAQTGEGRDFISTTFKLCKPLAHSSDVDNFKAWLTNAWTDLSMVNYPYPANFLEPLPAWPVKAVCSKLTLPVEGKQLLSDLSEAVKIYFNYSGQASCLNTTQQATSDLGDLGWDYQSCTEMVMPICADGKQDMFEPSPWNFTQFSEQCHKRWKTYPRENWIVSEYWGKSLETASNIIFSNGALDPWSSGGVTTSPSSSIVPLLIESGAHHLDLRAANPLDPPSVLDARQSEKNLLKMWLGQVQDDKSGQGGGVYNVYATDKYTIP